MDFDYDDDDDFALPPRLQDSLLSSSRTPNPLPLNEASGAGPTSPIQIDEEVVIKNKRKPQVKLIDRYIPSTPSLTQTTLRQRSKASATRRASQTQVQRQRTRGSLPDRNRGNCRNKI